MLFSGVYVIGGIKFYPPILFAFIGYFYFLHGKYTLHAIVELLIISIFIGVLFISVLLNDNQDTIFYLLRYIFKAIVIPVGCIFFISVLTENFHEYDILNCLFISVLIQLSIVVLQLMIPEFRAVFMQFIELSENWNMLSESGHFRATGLAGLSIYDSSIADAMLLIPFSLWAKDNKYLVNFKYIIVCVSLLFLSLLAGRSGFIFFLMCSIYAFVYSQKKYFFLATTIVMVCLSFLLAISIIGSDGVYDFSRFVFEPIYAFIETGTVKTESTSELFDSYLFIPWSVSPIIGDGYWAQPSISDAFQYQYKTDSGFILYYICTGFLGLLFVVTYVFWFVLNINNALLGWFDKVKSYGLKEIFSYFLILSFFVGVFLKAPANFSERIMPAYFVLMFIYNKRKITI